MEPNNQFGTVSSNQKWQLRWGHILIALFVIVLLVIAYIVIHQIKNADKVSQSSTSGGHHATAGSNNKSSSSSKKTPVATAPKPSTKSQTSPSPTANSNSTPLANTGPGDTIALFIGSVTVGTVGHYLYSRRRLGLTK